MSFSEEKSPEKSLTTLQNKSLTMLQNKSQITYNVTKQIISLTMLQLKKITWNVVFLCGLVFISTDTVYYNIQSFCVIAGNRWKLQRRPTRVTNKMWVLVIYAKKFCSDFKNLIITKILQLFFHVYSWVGTVAPQSTNSREFSWNVPSGQETWKSTTCWCIRLHASARIA